MNIGIHHFLHTYSVSKETIRIEENPTFRNFINKGVYIAGLLGVAAIVPQILKIWIGRETVGVSISTWVGFLIATLFWLVYGIIHKQKPIILTNAAALLAHTSIIIGLMLFKSS